MEPEAPACSSGKPKIYRDAHSAAQLACPERTGHRPKQAVVRVPPDPSWHCWRAHLVGTARAPWVPCRDFGLPPGQSHAVSQTHRLGAEIEHHPRADPRAGRLATVHWSRAQTRVMPDHRAGHQAHRGESPGGCAPVARNPRLPHQPRCRADSHAYTGRPPGDCAQRSTSTDHGPHPQPARPRTVQVHRPRSAPATGQTPSEARALTRSFVDAESFILQNVSRTQVRRQVIVPECPVRILGRVTQSSLCGMA